MTTQRTNKLLYAATAGFILLAIATIAVFFVPLDGAETGRESSATLPPAKIVDRNASAQASLASLEAVVARPLRRPMSDTGPVSAIAKPVAKPPTPAPISLILAGTIGDSIAMLRTDDGTIAAKAVGDEIAGAQVVAVREAQVDLRYNGKLITLDKSKEPPPQSANPAATDPAPQ